MESFPDTVIAIPEIATPSVFLKLFIEQLFYLFGAVSKQTSYTQLLAGLPLSDKLALYPEPPVCHLLPTVVVHLLFPVPALLLLQVPQHLDPPLLEREPPDDLLKGLVDSFEEDLDCLG